MYDISRLINHVTGNDSNKERELVEKLGFKDDLQKGYNRLRALVLNGKCDPEIRKRLPKALGVDSKFVEESLKKTHIKLAGQENAMQKQLEDLRSKSFRPYIWVEHEYDKLLSRSNIEADSYQRLKTIELPGDVNKLDWDDQVKIVRNIINLDQKKNKSRLFGNPINYIYFKDINESYLFDIYGGLIVSSVKPRQAECATA